MAAAAVVATLLLLLGFTVLRLGEQAVEAGPADSCAPAQEITVVPLWARSGSVMAEQFASIRFRFKWEKMLRAAQEQAESGHSLSIQQTEGAPLHRASVPCNFNEDFKAEHSADCDASGTCSLQLSLSQES